MTAVGCGRPHDQGAGYCPGCGLLLGGGAACPACGEPGEGGFFCEWCGHPLGPAPPPVTQAARPWFAVVTADRKLFAATRAGKQGFVLPDVAEQRLALTLDHIRIGRAGRATPPPDIDLSGPPPDPGVSREHAELLRQADGTWAVRDRGSANGTVVGRHHLAGDELTPVHEGDRILLGIWTRITLVQGD